MRSPTLRIATPLLLASAVLSSPAFAEPEDSVGLVISLEGQAVVHRGRGTHTVADRFLLEAGDTLSVGASSTCRGLLPGGEPFTLEGPAQLILEKRKPETPVTWIWNKIAVEIANWTGEPYVVPPTTRGVEDWQLEAPAPSLVVPPRGGAVRAKQARLVWVAIPGVERYVVTTARGEDDEEKRTVRGNSLEIEELVPGAEYVWKVEPQADDWKGHSSWSDFRVLTGEEETQLDLKLRDTADLEAGVLLLAVGLHDEAIHRLGAVIVNGDEVASARRWRARALYEVGLYRQAYEDLAQSGAAN
jgi:hypothetical protein